MDDYRRDFYKRYRTTHVETRKPGGTPEAHARRFPKWDRLIGPHLPRDRDGVVLDCGCGEGYLVSWLQARGYRRAGGVDASPEEVAVAHRLGLPVECAEIAPSLAARSGSVDFLIFRNVLEHLYKSEVVEMLLAAYRALRPGGAVWIQVPNAESPFGARLRYADFTHELAFTQVSISQVLRVCGVPGHAPGEVVDEPRVVPHERRECVAVAPLDPAPPERPLGPRHCRSQLHGRPAT